MIEKMVKVLCENYKRYLFLALLGFILTLILRIIDDSDHLIIRSILFAIAFVCGHWYIDIKKSFYDDSIFEFSVTLKLILIFVLSFVVISFLADILFGFKYGIITMLLCFFITVPVLLLFKTWFSN